MERISVIYKKEAPDLIYFLFKDTVTYRVLDTTVRDQHIEPYDLDFEGDRFMISKRYGDLQTLPGPKVSPAMITGLNLNNQSVWMKLRAEVKKDSIIYYFKQDVNFANREDVYFDNTAMGYAARLKNPRFFENFLKLNYDPVKHSPGRDSAWVFSGQVDVKGILTGVKLIEGETCAFSDFIRARLEADNNKWVPAMIHTPRDIRSYVKIYCRLNKDNTITLATPKRLLSWRDFK